MLKLNNKQISCVSGGIIRDKNCFITVPSTGLSPLAFSQIEAATQQTFDEFNSGKSTLAAFSILGGLAMRGVVTEQELNTFAANVKLGTKVCY